MILSRFVPSLLILTFFGLAPWTTLYAEEHTPGYFGEHERGWHWYHDPSASKPEWKLSQTSQSDPRVAMQQVREAVERALDAAILEPTPAHIEHYMQLQKRVVDNAAHFSKVWQDVLYQTPSLDSTITNPTDALARETYLDVQKDEENQAILHLAKHSGLFFFYRSSCPYCQRFAPIVKRFSERYGLTVVPITTDGTSLPDFPQSQVDSGQSSLFQVQVEPALFTVDPYTHKAVPVSYGLVSEQELKARLLEIAKGEAK